jgi:hypothetical protein
MSLTHGEPGKRDSARADEGKPAWRLNANRVASARTGVKTRVILIYGCALWRPPLGLPSLASPAFKMHSYNYNIAEFCIGHAICNPRLNSKT